MNIFFILLFYINIITVASNVYIFRTLRFSEYLIPNSISLCFKQLLRIICTYLMLTLLKMINRKWTDLIEMERISILTNMTNLLSISQYISFLSNSIIFYYYFFSIMLNMKVCKINWCFLDHNNNIMHLLLLYDTFFIIYFHNKLRKL